MWPFLLFSLLAADPSDSETILQELSSQCQTGSVIFSEGDCLAVKVFSGSRLTHCGAVMIEDGRPVVYDAMPGAGVRKTPLVDYLRLQTPSEIQMVHPEKPFAKTESLAYVEYLESQLGREYGIKHHLTGQRANGVHCAEYCTDALLAAGRISAEQPARVSPGSLYEGLTEHRLYTDGGTFTLAAKKTSTVRENESWCRWAWRETCDCTTGCCRQMSRWFLCREK